MLCLTCFHFEPSSLVCRCLATEYARTPLTETNVLQTFFNEREHLNNFVATFILVLAVKIRSVISLEAKYC